MALANDAIVVIIAADFASTRRLPDNRLVIGNNLSIPERASPSAPGALAPVKGNVGLHEQFAERSSMVGKNGNARAHAHRQVLLAGRKGLPHCFDKLRSLRGTSTRSPGSPSSTANSSPRRRPAMSRPPRVRVRRLAASCRTRSDGRGCR
jgi:hypothetical protein